MRACAKAVAAPSLEDCSVIAIDGISVSEYIHPMLTTLCQPMTAMGEATSRSCSTHRGTRRSSPRHLPTALREVRPCGRAQAPIFPGNPRENKFEKEY